MRFRSEFCGIAVCLLLTACTSVKSLSGDDYLATQLKPGRSYSNVFSISRSIKADGYDEMVRRNGGSADYSMISVLTDSCEFQIAYRYDGQDAANETQGFRDGGSTLCAGGKCAPNTDASGLIYNPTLWGKPPKRLTVGMSWEVHIIAPWELGGPNSIQTVTVVGVDPKARTATLMREGTSAGYFADDPKQARMSKAGQPVVLNLIPGVSQWRGYATFAQGVVISDELIVTRTDILRNEEGQEVTGLERRIMILNASPIPAKRT